MALRFSGNFFIDNLVLPQFFEKTPDCITSTDISSDWIILLVLLMVYETSNCKTSTDISGDWIILLVLLMAYKIYHMQIVIKNGHCVILSKITSASDAAIPFFYPKQMILKKKELYTFSFK